MNGVTRTLGTRSICLAILLCLYGTASAADIEREGSRLRVQGALDVSGLVTLIEQLANGKVSTVVFEDSRGGSADIAAQYAKVIRDARVNTEVRGQCNAACAYAFLAGKEHRFGRGSQVNSLLVPLGAKPGATDLAQLTSRMTAKSVNTDLSSAPPLVREPIPSAVRDAWQPDQGVLFTSTPTLFGRVYNSFYCDGSQGRDLSSCESLKDADPYRLGVLTLQ